MARPKGEMQKSLSGKAVLITGGARRIGREIALQMAQAGADTAITFLTSQKEAQRTVVDLGGFGVRALALKCDVRDERSIESATQGVVREFGGVDILVNNAGAFESANLQEITVSQWDDMFAVNTRGPWLFSRACAGELRKRKGRIINLGSLGGIRPWQTHAHYCQSKAALHMQTLVLAKSLAPDIAVNCVAPGMIDLGEKPPSTLMQRLAKKAPMRRNGSAADVAAAVLQFAAAPHFITGQILAVEGGLALV